MSILAFTQFCRHRGSLSWIFRFKMAKGSTNVFLYLACSLLRRNRHMQLSTWNLNLCRRFLWPWWRIMDEKHVLLVHKILNLNNFLTIFSTTNKKTKKSHVKTICIEWDISIVVQIIKVNNAR